ncbi:ATP-dependent metallopeptidase FtsH/Yme1/Tma family protein, partial [Microvirga roseola]|uniref:ATP-dependent metallopeptidase FtsH/Yme1/Tma family protein n=1 Tax=Microvirga roseola TaxID=2883126 RepID=UPI001E582EBB
MNNPNNPRGLFQYAAIAALFALLALVYVQNTSAPQSDQLPYSAFVSAVEQGEIRSVTIQGQNVIAERTTGGQIETYAPQGADLVGQLQRQNVEIKAAPPPQPNLLLSLLISFLPWLLILGVGFWMLRRAASRQGGAGGLMSVGKSKA